MPALIQNRRILTGAQVSGVAFANDFGMLSDGVDEYINVADITELDGIAAMTISIWIKQPNFSGNTTLISKWNPHASQSSWAIQTNTAGEFLMFIASAITDGGSNNGITTNAALAVNTWYHVLIRYDGAGATNADRLKIFVDNVETTMTYEGTIPATLTTSTAPVEIGRFGDLGRFWLGNEDEVSIWTKVFDADERTEIYNNRLALDLNTHSAISSLVYWNRMGDGATHDGTNWSFPDDSANNYTAASVLMEEADRVNDPYS